jgi:hypothetical protein
MRLEPWRNRRISKAAGELPEQRIGFGAAALAPERLDTLDPPLRRFLIELRSERGCSLL